MLLQKRERQLLYASNLWYLAEGMLGPLFALYVNQIGYSLFDVSWTWALYLITLGIIIIFVGYLSDTYSKEKFLFWGYFSHAICTFGYLFVENTFHLALVQIGLGISAGFSTPTWNALYARYENKEHDGLTWGLANGIDSICTGAALIIGGIVITYTSFKLLFVMMGILHLLATLSVYKFLRKN